MKNITYKKNTEPKVGDKVRFERDIKEGIDALYEIQTILGGRVGNKVSVRMVAMGGKPIVWDPTSFIPDTECYCFGLCPQ